jgi:transcriptional regulator with XRE-family HTH domain
MDIKSVIQRHGFQLQEVSAKMEVKHSTLSGMLSGNPTIGTLRKIVDAINAMNEEKQLTDRCYLAEFFADELPAGFTLTSSATEQPTEAVQQPVEEKKQEGEASAADELPFDNKNDESSASQKPDLTADIAFICPHCHEAIKLGFVK